MVHHQGSAESASYQLELINFLTEGRGQHFFNSSELPLIDYNLGLSV